MRTKTWPSRSLTGSFFQRARRRTGHDIAIEIIDPLMTRADEFLFFRTPLDSATQVRANGGQGANLVVRFLQHHRSFIVYWQTREISRVLSQCNPVANAVDTSLLEHVSPIEWDNVVLYGQYILDRKLVRRCRRRSMKVTFPSDGT